MTASASKTFECPSCENPCHVDYLEYDRFGGGCPHCGYHLAFLTIKELTERTDQ
jgi:hypothetical protein